MSRNPLVIIVGGTKYVEAPDKPSLVDRGMGTACSFENGDVYICLSRTGVPMARHAYWPDQYSAQTVTTYVGKDAVVQLLTRLHWNREIENILAAMGETLKEA